MQEEVIEGFRLAPQQKGAFQSAHADAFIVQAAFAVQGTLDADLLAKSWLQLQAEHEILRTGFQRLPGMSLPLQVVAEETRALVVHEGEIDLAAFCREEADALEAMAPIRLTLAGGEQRFLILSMLPQAGDSAAIDNIAAALLDLYAEGAPERELDAEAFQYIQFSEWQNELDEEEEAEEGKAFWQRHLGDTPERIAMPDEAALASFDPQFVAHEANEARAEQVEALSQQLGIEPAHFYAACWQLYLGRMAGAERALLDLYCGGREFEEVEAAPGRFGKYVPLITALDPAGKARALLTRFDEVAVEARTWQGFHDAPFDVLSEDDLAFSMVYGGSPTSLQAGELALDPAHVRIVDCYFSLQLRVDERGAMTLGYDATRFDEARATRILDAVAALCDSVLVDVDKPLRAYSYAGAAEMHYVLDELGKGAVDVPEYRCPIALFEGQVDATPERVAFEHLDESFTFAELDRRANRLANRLRAAGAGPDSVIPILMERSVHLLEAVLGIWKAGAAYLPLDPGQPKHRAGLVLDRVLAPAIVTLSDLRDTYGDRPESLICLDKASEGNDARPGITREAESLAYVLFTSGSTGEPKGSMIRNRAVFNLAHALRREIYTGASEPERITINASFGFDSSVKQMVQILFGNTMVLVPEAIRLDGEAMLAFLTERQIQVLDCTPSQLMILLEAGLEQNALPLGKVLMGGEAVDGALWSRLAGHEQIRFFNLYGPTECTVNTTWSPITADLAPTIGRPIPGCRIVLHDDHGYAVPLGTPGEILVGGLNPARGYLGSARQTAERFVPNPHGAAGSRLYRTGDLARFSNAGELVFMGRIDHQVKLRGFRIELGEIESVIKDNPAVRDAAVVLREDTPGHKRLAAYAVRTRKGSPVLDGHVRHTLPNGMAVCHQNQNESNYLYEEIFAKKTYVFYGIQLPENAVVFDVGANIGMFSLFTLAHCKNPRIYAFEPLPPIYDTLSHNMELYGENVKLFNFGISDSDQSLTFTYYPHYSMMSSAEKYARTSEDVGVVKAFLEKEAESGSAASKQLLENADELLDGRFTAEEHECHLRRFSDVFAEIGEARIDLLKVDVQRAEMDVLRGMTDENWSRVQQVVMEVHQAEGEESANRLAEVTELLEKHGLKVIYEQDELLEGTDRYNLYAAREGLKQTSHDFAELYITPNFADRARPLDEQALRDFLHDRLPEYMLPADLVFMDRLPLTRTGKIDRKQLPAPKNELENLKPAATATERKLLEIWQDLLGIEKIGADMSFFNLGGHSLLATRLMSRVRAVFGVSVPLRVVFDAPVLEDMARLLDEEMGTGEEAAGPVALPRDRELPLSFAQQRLWFIDQMDPGSPEYNTPKVERLTGSLDLAALEQALNDLVARHESLRTTFPREKGQPRQLIHEPQHVALSVDEADGEEAVQAWIDRHVNHRFDLANGPLFTFHLLRVAADDHVLLINSHHIITDAWSVDIMWREVTELYAAHREGRTPKLDPLPIQYADFAAWQRDYLSGERLEQELAFWRHQLGGELPVLQLPGGKARPARPGNRGAHVRTLLSESASQGLRQHALAADCTAFMAVFALLESLLFKLCGQDEICIGTPTLGRDREEVAGLIGFFINTVVLRGNTAGDPSFRELLGRVRTTALDAFAHQDIPFEMLVDEVAPERDLSHTPIFQVVYNYREGEADAADGDDDLTNTGIRYEIDLVKFDLTFSVLNPVDGPMGFTISYREDLFERDTIERMAGQLRALADSVAADWERPLSRLDLVSEQERKLFEAEWNTPVEEPLPFTTIHDAFHAHARRNPDAIALSFEDETWTYSRLSEEATRLSRQLLSMGVVPGSMVAVYLEPSPRTIVALLGIMGAGGGYVPLDHGVPTDRLEYILNDTATPVVLSETALEDRLPSGFYQLICLDEPMDEDCDHIELPQVSTEQIAYAIYTSGSTGRPKGVLVAHYHVARLFGATERWYHFDENDVWTLFHSYAFDFSVWEIWGALCHGGRLVVVPYLTARDPKKFLRLLIDEKVTILNQTPSAFYRLVEADTEAETPQHLREVIFGGEALNARALQPWVARHGLEQPRLVNMYGITETTVFTTYRPLTQADMEDGNACIGVRIDDLTVYLLDNHMAHVPINTPGELHVGGEAPAVGYLGRPALTATKFVPDPFSKKPGARLYKSGDLACFLPDGDMRFLGRIDHQVKIRGFRMELGEIEATLTAAGSIARAAIVVDRRSVDDARLVAFYIAEQGATPDPAELRRQMATRLPEYMIPSAFVQVDNLPLTVNGKLDTRLLLAEAAEAAKPAEGRQPRNQREQLLVNIWQEVLQLEDLTIDDHFFERGGHSLLATRLVARVREELGAEVPLRLLFENPTPAEMAPALNELVGTDETATLSAIDRDGKLPLSFAQQRLWFIDRMDPGTPTYNVPLTEELPGELDGDALEAALDATVARHEILRTVFPERDGEAVAEILPHQPRNLERIDLSHLDEEMRTRHVTELRRAAYRHRFDLASGPLFTYKLVKLAEEAHLLLINMHHIITDGWSLPILWREVQASYLAISEGLPMPQAPALQYADFAAWQRSHLQGEQLERQLAFWREALGADHTPLDLPIDYPRPALPGDAGETLELVLPERLNAGLLTLAQKHECTPFMTVYATLSVLLSRYASRRDIRIGTPVSGREHPATQDMLGFFVNTLVMQLLVDGAQGFDQLLAQARQTTLDAFAHGEVPFEKLVEELLPERDTSHSPLFQVALTWQDVEALDEEESRSSNLPAVRSGLAQFDLGFTAVSRPNAPLQIYLDYKTDLFKRNTAQRILDSLQTLLAEVIDGATRPVRELDVLGEHQRSFLLETCNAPEVELEGELLLHRLLAAQALLTPEEPALAEEGNGSLSYAQLQAEANRLAHHLIAQGVKPGQVVALHAAAGARLMVGLLATLKAGAVFLPIDTTYPAERITYMLEDAGVSQLLADAAHILPDVPATALDSDFSAYPDSEPKLALSPDHGAYVLYTSGSTGKPKGSLTSHRAIVTYLMAMRESFAIRPGDRWLQLASISFDVFLEETLPSLLDGGTVVFPNEQGLRSADELQALIEAERITGLELSAAHWAGWVDDLIAREQRPPASLRLLLLGCEKIPADRFEAWQPFGVRTVGVFGLTETAITTTLNHLDASDDLDARSRYSIGYCVDNAPVYVLDPDGLPAPLGVAGEMFIGGAGLAQYYVGRPALTAERFVPHPFGTQGERLYKTGDRACRLPDGRIDFLGRLDHQLKLRGFRIEPAEIETELKAQAGIEDALVTVHRDGNGTSRLVAYLVGQPEHDNARMAADLAVALPRYMVPQAFVVLDALPLTPNGKIDRKRLPEPNFVATTETPASESTDPVIATLGAIWSEVLGLPVAEDANFFELGGHSLVAIKLLSRLNASMGVALSPRAIFEHPTVAQFAELVRAAQGESSAAQLPAMTTADRSQRIPLSYSQQRLWFIDQMDPGSFAYNVPVAHRLEGELDREALQAALSEMVRRHEILRTSFPAEKGKPFQRIADPHTQPLPVTDLSHLAPEAAEDEARKLASEEARFAFDLATGPLFRSGLIKLNDTNHVLLLNMHHIVTDFWSMEVFWSEAVALYEAFAAGMPSPLDEPRWQFADFAAWQRKVFDEDGLSDQLAYWRKQLGGELPVLNLPVDRVRKGKPKADGGLVKRSLSPAQTERLRALAGEEQASLFMALSAALSAMLARYCGQKDICIGTPIAGRNQLASEELMGFFVNTLVLRTHLGGAPSFRELLGRMRQTTLDAFANQDVPFERLVEELAPKRDVSHTPLYQVPFTFEEEIQPLGEAAEAAEAEEGVAMKGFAFDLGLAKFDLAMTAGPAADGGFTVSFGYKTDVFEQATVARFADHFITLIEAVCADGDTVPEAIELLSDEERSRIDSWSHGSLEALPLEDAKTLFESRVAMVPDAPALSFEGQVLSYAELNSRANRLAHHLIGSGVTPESTVAICLERSPEAVIALLAVLKASATYLMLDPEYPAERLGFMLGDAGPTALITDDARADAVPSYELNFINMLVLEEIEAELAEEREDNPSATPHPDMLAYLVYTSGSTGKPKGVAVTHRGLANLVAQQVRAFEIDGRARLLQFASPSFDASVSELFTALSSGACLVMASRERILPGPMLDSLMREEQVTHVTLPPSALAYMPEKLVPSLRCLVVAGEACAPDLAQRYADKLRFIDAYGPSENSVCATLTTIEPGWENVPIGTPIGNVEVHLLDDRLAPVPVGVTGRIFLSGIGLARGYHNRPALTAERFLPHPHARSEGLRLYDTGDLGRFTPDGMLHFAGRADHQIKLRGFRIELGEVEAALRTHASVSDAVAVVREDTPGNRRLVAYVVPDFEHPHDEEGSLSQVLRAHVAASLPDYMVPALVAEIEELPLSPNGKVDRAALPLPEAGESQRVFRHPRTDLEGRIWQIYAEVLGLDRISIDDSFFELGGHSLLAVELMLKLKDLTGREMSLDLLFEHPSVEDLAAALDAEGIATRKGALVKLAEGDDEPLFLVHPSGGTAYCYVQLARLLVDRTCYAFQAQGLEGDTAPREDMAEFVEAYIAELTETYPEGPIHLAGYSFGGLAAFAMAQRLREMGREVASLCLLDSQARSEPKLDGPDEAGLLRAFVEGMDLAPERAESLFTGEWIEDAVLSAAMEAARAAGLITQLATLDQVRAHYRVDRGCVAAAERYAVAPYAGAITLIHTAEFAPADLALWRSLAQAGLHTVQVNGEHETLLDPPTVKDVAAAMATHLAEQRG